MVSQLGARSLLGVKRSCFGGNIRLVGRIAKWEGLIVGAKADSPANCALALYRGLGNLSSSGSGSNYCARHSGAG
jgi:hypothetical protein